MAATGQVTVALSFTPTNGIAMTIAPGPLTIAPAADAFCQNLQSVPTSKTALTVGGVSTSGLGYVFLRNLDATNYVSLFSDSSSATEICRLAANGGVALLPLGPASTPFLLANTATCKVQVFLISA